jgi:tetratricopeptide (TPR) repeat protein
MKHIEENPILRVVQQERGLAEEVLRLGCVFLACALALSIQALAMQHASGRDSSDFTEVKSLAQQGHLEEARTRLLVELQENPKSIEGYNLLGILDSNLQDFSGSQAAFQHALELAPNSTKTHTNLGNLYVAEKKLDTAEKEFRTVLRLDPKNADGNYNLGLLLMAKGALSEAIAHFERIQPSNSATQLNLVRAYFESKRQTDALRKAADISTRNKGDIQVHFSLGLLLASEKQYKPAELELEQADALAPGTYEILYNLGLALLRSGEYAKAELVADRALKLKPESPEALYLLAQVVSEESRPLDALDLLVRAHKVAPENIEILYLMAQISISQNYFEDAIPLLESGVKLAPRRPDLLAALGESYFMAGKVDKAVEDFNKLIEIEPSARSYAFLGLSYRHLGRFDEAKGYFQKGLKLDPHNSTCLFNLGYMAERQGDVADAETKFTEILRTNPNYADALLELANLRLSAKKLPEAEDLLRRYVKVGRDPATGYYKLAMVERSLHETAAADRDLGVFQTMSKDVAAGPYPYEHLFDYLDERSKLAPEAKQKLDLSELTEQIKKHPDQPEDLYLLAETYLKSGNIEQAKDTIVQLDTISSGDYRTMAGVGVLLARYHYYDNAIQHFEAALAVNPDSDDVKFDLMNAYFRKAQYPKALEVSEHVSEGGRKDDAFLTLLGDIYAHSGDALRAKAIFQDAIRRNPDNDQDYLSLALLQFREKDIAGAKQTLLKGQTRVPASGKILWGMGIASVLEGNTNEAAERFERAVDVMPEWPGSYSTLGVFYFETGQIAKAKEVLSRFKNSGAHGGFDINRIEEVLEQAPESHAQGEEPMTAANREQLLQLALSLADRTL